jgi:putative membrane protein insertion efficiency factor
MRKKIQQQSRREESGSQTTLGVVPSTKSKSSGRASGNDSPKIHHDCKATGCSGGSAESITQGTDNRGVMNYLSLSGLAILLIILYQQIISPWIPARCRFAPTCSHYAIESLKVHGFFKGSALAIWRLLRCQPFCHGGFDPVPLPKHKIKKDLNSEI